MFNFTNPPELPQQLKWKYAEEPELLAWAIRARNYNTFVANCMFAFMSLVLLGLSYFLYSAYHGMDEPWRIISCLFFLRLHVIYGFLHDSPTNEFRLSHCSVRD
jgi:hypothetical protein